MISSLNHWEISLSSLCSVVISDELKYPCVKVLKFISVFISKMLLEFCIVLCLVTACSVKFLSICFVFSQTMWHKTIMAFYSKCSNSMLLWWMFFFDFELRFHRGEELINCSESSIPMHIWLYVRKAMNTHQFEIFGNVTCFVLIWSFSFWG